MAVVMNQRFYSERNELLNKLVELKLASIDDEVVLVALPRAGDGQYFWFIALRKRGYIPESWDNALITDLKPEDSASEQFHQRIVFMLSVLTQFLDCIFVSGVLLSKENKLVCLYDAAITFRSLMLHDIG